MASQVSLSRVLNEVELVKQEVESNKQLLITILSTLKTFKYDSLKSYSSLYSKIEEVENNVNSVKKDVNEIIGPQEVPNNSENCDIDPYEASTVDSGESKNLPNVNITEVTFSEQLFEENSMIKVEGVKEEPIEDNSWREEFYEENRDLNEDLDNANDSSLQNYEFIQEYYEEQSPDLESNADFLSDAESPLAFKKRTQIKKCRDGCPNCDKQPCRKCDYCLAKRRCKFKACSEYKKLLESDRRVNSICPKCNKSFSTRTSLKRHHANMNSCVREPMKYQDFKVRCFEVDCQNTIYPNFKSYGKHRILSGHKKYKFRCDICMKFISSKSMKCHIKSHANKSSKEVIA